jgi:hypothetical protein
MSRDNYYILLDISISPPEEDASKINAAIHKKQVEWAKLRIHPTKGRQAQLYLDLLADIKAVMMDDEKRKAEAEEARKIKAKEEIEKYKDLDNAIKLLSTKKQITEDELKKLAQRFSLTEDDVRKRIKVPIVKNESKKNSVKRLEASVAKKIADALKIIGKKSLYDFLELSPTSSIKILQSKTKDKDTELKRDSNKDAVQTAGLELIGHCSNVFKTEDMRKMYDATLAYQQLEELDKAIEIAGLDKKIDVEEFDSLMKTAKELGLRLDEAEEHIFDYCDKRKWIVRSPTNYTVEEMKACGNCGVVNPKDAKNCFGCGFPLNVDCPGCQKKNPCTNTNCTQCGFPIGDMPNAMPLLKEAKEARAHNDHPKAAAALRKALLFWPDHPEAVSMLRKIEDREQEITQLAQELGDRLDEKKYYAARQLFFRLKRLDPAHPQLSLETTIEGKIKSAESWVKKARTAAKGDDALDCFSRALMECKDCREAVEGMAKYPPDPPIGLKAVPSARSITLQWSKSTSRGDVTYAIVRKSQSSPLNALDGETLGETTQTFFDEPGAQPGELYYYGIYSKRGDVYSKSGAIAGPVMRTAEVKNLSATPGDGRINLNWEPPPNIQVIEVRMKAGGQPSGRSDGRSLGGVRGDGVVVTGLTNGRTYGFRVFAVFKNEKGTGVYSGGTGCLSKPTSPPPPVKDLKAVKKENNIDATWTPPGKGTVQLISSKRPFPVECGEMVSAAKLSGLGTQVPVRRAGEAQIPINFQGLLHIMPVTVEGDIAVIGEPVTATSINEVSNLKGYINSGRLYLEWDWPAGANKVLIMYGNNAFPTLQNDSDAVKKTFHRNEYLRNSGFVLRSVEEKDYYFSVHVSAGEGETLLYSAGSRCMVNNTGHVELYYEIHLGKNFLGKIKFADLKLYTKEGSYKLPEAVLIKKVKNLPLRKSDGIKIMEVKSTQVGTYPVNIEIPDRELQKGAYVKLFFKNDAQHQRYRIIPPSRDKLQLG